MEGGKDETRGGINDVREGTKGSEGREGGLREGPSDEGGAREEGREGKFKGVTLRCVCCLTSKPTITRLQNIF